MARAKLSNQEVAQILENFIEGGGGKWDWDDFLSFPLQDERLEAIRGRAASLSEEFPPTKPGEYCNQQGVDVLREYIRQLRTSS